MRTWDEDNPKAGLLARKRAAILDAARREFLEKGFGNATMAGVAAAAGVSVATLYRHARSKEDLFTEVVTLRLDPSHLAEGLARLAALPVHEALLMFAEGFLGMLLTPGTLALYRMVIAEAHRFPKLGPIAFDAVYGHVADSLARFLAPRMGEDAANAFAPEFLSQVAGDRPIRALLDVPYAHSPETERRRVSAIAAALGVPPSPPT